MPKPDSLTTKMEGLSNRLKDRLVEDTTRLRTLQGPRPAFAEKLSPADQAAHYLPEYLASRHDVQAQRQMIRKHGPVEAAQFHARMQALYPDYFHVAIDSMTPEQKARWYQGMQQQGGPNG